MAKKRGAGEGSITKRKDGRWSAILTVGYSEAGKRLRRSVYGATKSEVTTKLTRLQNQKLDGTLTATTRITMGDYLDRWLGDAVKLSARPTTHQSYEQLCRLHIKPLIGGLQLTKLSPANVQWLYAELGRQGKSRRIQYQCHAVLHRALEVALKWGLVARNVSDAVERPTVRTAEVKPLDSEAVRKFIRAAAGDRLEALYVMALCTGARQGELFGLRWDDVDLQNQTVQIRRTIVEMGGEFHEHEPKTEKGKRLIVLPAMAVEALHEQRKRLLAEGLLGGGLVFPDHAGGYLRRQNVCRRSFAAILKAAKLPDTVRFHDLRHSHATMLLTAGIHPRVVQERLGHSQIAVTLGTYSHVLPTMQADAAAKVQTIMSEVG
ncbi:MAG TPA: site-specific integrase [Planctomycetaceae bacterium]|nr:site-specific integrase [Planctomycetaceae bacterium]